MWGMSKYFGDRHRELIDEKIARYRASADDPRIKLVDRVNQLEDDLGRTLLLLVALADTCMAKGVLTKKDITEMAKKIDPADGVPDGKLDPEAVWPESASRSQPPVSPEEHFRRLEEES